MNIMSINCINLDFGDNKAKTQSHVYIRFSVSKLLTIATLGHSCIRLVFNSECFSVALYK